MLTNMNGSVLTTRNGSVLTLVDYNLKFIQTALPNKTAGTVIKTPEIYLRKARNSRGVGIRQHAFQKKADDSYFGVMEYRNTPVTGMTYSPSQLKTSRKNEYTNIKRIAPVCSGKRSKAATETTEKIYDKSTKPLPPLAMEEQVYLYTSEQHLDTSHHIRTGLSTKAIHIITTDEQRYRRNRRDLLKINIPSTISTYETENVNEKDYPTTIQEQPLLDS